MEAKTLALYLGCDVVNQYGSRYKLTGVYTKAIPHDNCQRIQVFDGHHIFWFDFDKIQLLLRPLSSMTEEEGMEIFEDWSDDFPNARDVIKNNDDVSQLTFLPTEFKAMLSKGFDLFGLIEKGEALDLTQQKGIKQ